MFDRTFDFETSFAGGPVNIDDGAGCGLLAMLLDNSLVVMALEFRGGCGGGVQSEF